MSETDASKARSLSRQITKDGRNSLRSHLFGERAVPLSQQWSQRVLRKETLPLFLIIASGCAFAAGFGVRHLTYSPDVQVNKVNRAQSIRTNEAEGKNWVKHRESLKKAAPYVPPAAEKSE